MSEKGVFDPVAAEYDETFTDTEIGKRQRAQVYAAIRPFLAVDRELSVLELNCGTGADAVWMHREFGHRVLATDASAEMVEVAVGKMGVGGVLGVGGGVLGEVVGVDVDGGSDVDLSDGVLGGESDDGGSGSGLSSGVEGGSGTGLSSGFEGGSGTGLSSGFEGGSGTGLSSGLLGQQVAFSEVGDKLKGMRFDFVLSNFGGLNCIDEKGLKQLAGELLELVNVGGKVALVVMAPWTWWEWLYFGVKFRWKRAFARAGKGSVAVPLGGGVFQETWYFSPRRVELAFCDGDLGGAGNAERGERGMRGMRGERGGERGVSGFRKVLQRPIGFWVPPGYLEPLFVWRRKWLDRFVKWDLWWGARGGAAGFGDHFLIVFERV